MEAAGLPIDPVEPDSPVPVATEPTFRSATGAGAWPEAAPATPSITEPKDQPPDEHATEPEEPTAAETPSQPATVAKQSRQGPKRRLGLRARVTIAFAVGAFALSSALAGITYFVVRASLIDQQTSSMRSQALANAVLLKGELRAPVHYIGGLISTLDSGPNTGSLIYSHGKWYPSSPFLSSAQLPTELVASVLSGVPSQQIVSSSGTEQFYVGTPLHSAKAYYFEVFDLSSLARTLHVLLASLTIAAIVTTIAGAIVGLWAASRALRPLHETAQAALAIAGGRTGTRLESGDFADLAVLASAFNRMVDQLQERIEREARFSSDVNHELRSPLTTLAASLSVLEARRNELPPKALQALDLLGAEVRRFRRLVDELLEISRSTPGDLSQVEVSAGELVENTVRTTDPAVPILFAPGVESRHLLVDKRRFERILANLFENAARYAGGATLVAVEDHGSSIRFIVEDAGPGIAPEERDRIFERFSRGSTGKRRGLGDGTGLGLAIVAQHVHQHGGRVWVEGRPDGGSRFVVELPAMDEEAE